jgi:hypothetical protein
MDGNGQPQSSLVWPSFDGFCARVDSPLERQQRQNLAANARASLLGVDPDDTSRYLQIRGDVELADSGATPDPRAPRHVRRDPRPDESRARA